MNVYEKDYLEPIVTNSKTYAEILRKLKRKMNSGNYQTLQKYIRIHQINTDHLMGKRHLQDTLRPRQSIPIEQVLVENSNYSNTTSLKKRLLKMGLLKNKCYIDDCPTLKMDNWLNKEIVYQLDHINGIRHDNRLENLRLLCPICHTQTNNYAGRNIKTASKELVNSCLLCESPIKFYSLYCRECAAKKEKINWPPIDELLKRVQQENINTVAAELGVSFNGLKKHINKHKGQIAQSEERKPEVPTRTQKELDA